MNKKDQDAIKTLAREGKTISKIMEQDYPDYEYWEIYEAVYNAGGKSALGVKRTIANRLATLLTTRKKQEKTEIIEEIDELVWHLYESLKSSQKKLDVIRKALTE